MASLPMSRFRILELGAAVAAPFAAAVMADAGAEVIKLETERRPDNLRTNFPMAGGTAGIDRSYYFGLINRNKRGLTLDLTQRAGREAFLDLVAVSDALVENFAAGTMERLGLGYETVRQRNPALVMVSLSGFGATGPTKDYIAYGPVLEGASGMAYLHGYKDRPPTNSAYVYTDYLSGAYAASLLLSGLVRRLETGEGAYVDLSQLEVSLHAIPDAALSWAVNGVLPPKRENRDPFVTINGCFPCSGNDQWVSIAARTEPEWQGLCEAMEHPEWTRLPQFADTARRAANIDDLERRIAAWTSQHTPQEVAAALQRRGIAAMPVLSIGQVYQDPHLRERGAIQQNPHPIVGTQPAYASPIHIDGVPREIRRHAPLWGEDNDYVCREVLGLSASSVQRMVDTKTLR